MSGLHGHIGFLGPFPRKSYLPPSQLGRIKIGLFDGMIVIASVFLNDLLDALPYRPVPFMCFALGTHVAVCCSLGTRAAHDTCCYFICAGRESLPSGKYQHMYTMSGRSFSIVRYNSLYPITPVVARTAKPL